MKNWFSGCALILLVSFLIHIPCAFGAGNAKDRIMVWQLEAKTGVSSKDIDSLSGYVTAQVEQYAGRRVISEADIDTVLKGAEAQQQCGANENATACMAEIGNALGVPEAVAGDLGRVGKIWILNLRRIDLRKVMVTGRISRQIKGDDITPVVEALPGAVAELFGKTAQASIPVAAPQPEPLTVTKKVEPPMSSFEKAAFGTFFPGVALVGLGGIGSWQMKSAWDDYSEAAPGSSKEDDAQGRHDTWKAVSATAYVVGGALMITGITLWILDAVKRPDPQADKEQQPEVTVTVAPAERGATVGIWGRW